MIELANSTFYTAMVPTVSPSDFNLLRHRHQHHHHHHQQQLQQQSHAQSSSAPISPTLPLSSSALLTKKKHGSGGTFISPIVLSSPAGSTTSSSASSSLVSFLSTGSKATDTSGGTAGSQGRQEEERLAQKLRNLQISELINAILLVEGKLKREKKKIMTELKQRDLIIGQQMREIEAYKRDRLSSSVCGLCQQRLRRNASPVDGPSGSGAGAGDCLNGGGTGWRESRNVEVQTEANNHNSNWRGDENVVADPLSNKDRRNNVEGETSRKERGDVEIVDDWYANGGSDNEQDKGSPVNLYDRGVNPMLERVNQILLQGSMDNGLEAEPNKSAPSPKLPTTKRVQFSAPTTAEYHNQQQVGRMMATTRIPEMRKVAAPVGKCFPIVKPPPADGSKMYNSNSSGSSHPPRLPENEYEVIGSEQDSGATNMYGERCSDADSQAANYQMPQPLVEACRDPMPDVSLRHVPQLTRKDGMELLKLIAHPGTPPALPPKPANLMKFKKVLSPLANHQPVPKDTHGKKPFEPDYCSISECGTTSGKNAASADDLDDETASKVSIDTMENVPKLPNVAAIIVPKPQHKQQQQHHHHQHYDANGLVINKDNYVTKTITNSAKTGSTPPPPSAAVAGHLSGSPQQNAAKVADLKRFVTPSSRHHLGPKAFLEKRQNIMARLDTGPGANMLLKRYSLEAIGAQLHAEETKYPAQQSVFDEIPIQAEFDWYNLDAEFSKLGQRDVITEARSPTSSDGSNFGEMQEQDEGTEGDENAAQDECCDGRSTSRAALNRSLSELKDIERKMSTLDRQKMRKDGNKKEIVHFC